VRQYEIDIQGHVNNAVRTSDQHPTRIPAALRAAWVR